MKTNFNTVNELTELKSENKMAQYVNMARAFANEATLIAETSKSFMVKMAAKEVVSSMRKAESADCDFTAYVNANAAEKWLEKVITGKL